MSNMFTGIVEELGTIRAIQRGTHSAVLSIGASLVLSDLKIGDSVAVNGVCLTATGKDGGGFTADVMHETLNRSSLGKLVPGSPVNLERAMPANGRFGGHIVSGHIDGVGTILSVHRDDNALWYTVRAAPELLRYSVSHTPHPAMVTVLGRKRPGDTVNLETDIIGKYVEELLNPQEELSSKGGITMDFLRENGF